MLFLVCLLLYDKKFANWNDQSFGDTCLVPGCLARKISQIRMKKKGNFKDEDTLGSAQCPHMPPAVTSAKLKRDKFRKSHGQGKSQALTQQYVGIRNYIGS